MSPRSQCADCAGLDKVQTLTPDMGLQLLEQNVGWNFKDNIRHEENRQRGVVFRAIDDVQILLKSENCSIANIDSARRS